MSKDLVNLYKTDKRFLIIRAPPGSGKTFSALKYAIEKALEGKRIGIFFRTRKEVEYALEIYWELVRQIDKAPIAMPLVGKEKLCRFPPRNPDLARWWCAFISCEFVGRASPDSFLKLYLRNKPRNIEEIVGISFDSGGCPYQNVISTINSANIILATHPYFISDALFEKLSPIDEAIIDEAHSFLLLKTAEIVEEEYLLGRRYEGMELNRVGVALYREGNKKDAFSLVRFANFVDAPGEELKLRGKRIKVIFPKVLFERRLKELSKIILISATIYPESLFKKMFLPKQGGKLIVRRGILNTKNRSVYGLAIGLTTRFTDRNESFLRKYANIIKALSKMVRPIVVFTPSYELAEKIAEKLGTVVSRDSLVENDIIVVVMRSRFSEGIELKVKGKEPKLGIIIGLPFPRIEEETRKIIAYYSRRYGLSHGSLMKAYMFSKMISALIQAIGRIGRRDKGVIVIIDDRIKTLPLGIQVFENISSLLERIMVEFS